MVSVRFTAGRRGAAVPAIIAAAALATAVTACGSSGSSGSSTATGTATASGTATGTAASSSASASSTAKVTGAAATALISKAIANTKAAPSLTVVASGLASGSGGSSQKISFNLTLVQKAGCRGTIAQSKAATFQLIETGGYVWLKPSNAYYDSLHISQAALALIGDKYIKVPVNNANFADLAKICSFSGLFGQFKTPSGTSYVATPTTYQGRSAYLVTQSGQPGSLYITNAATPMLAKLTDPTASGGTITFTEYSVPLTITAPPAAESIDGTKLGL